MPIKMKKQKIQTVKENFFSFCSFELSRNYHKKKTKKNTATECNMNTKTDLKQKNDWKWRKRCFAF